MNARTKKPVMFAIIVVIGSILVLFDVPLVLLLPLILILGFAILVAMGSLTTADLRQALKFEDLKKIGILRRLDDMKFFEKKGISPGKAPVPPPQKTPEKKPPEKGEQKPGPVAHIGAFLSSLGSLGSVLRQRGKQGKKVEDINRLLDRTVSEKVTAPPPAAPKPAAAAGSPPGGAGGSLPAPPAGEDPFMSLSGDEFDEGLLEGLGEDLTATPGPAPGAPVPDTGSGAVPAAAPDLSLPAPDISAAAGDILKEAGGEGGIDAEGLSDETLNDLDNLNLDEVSLDADLGEGPDATVAAPAPAPETPVPPAPAAGQPAAGQPPDSGAVKTAWIPSDAPKDATESPDDVSTQADMAAFASGPGGDEDLLSSIASDVKRSTKEQDLSLLRELKDFRAPASEIQKELGGMFERLSQAQQTPRKKPPATDEKK